MTAMRDTRYLHPFCTNRTTTVPPVSHGYSMHGTDGTVGTVDKEEELLLYIEDYLVRYSSLIGVTSVPSVPR
jgi:hypothetical protein